MKRVAKCFSISLTPELMAWLETKQVAGSSRSEVIRRLLQKIMDEENAALLGKPRG